MGRIGPVLEALPPVYNPKMPKIFSPAALLEPLRVYLQGKPAAGGKFFRFGVREYGFIRGKARRRREKIAILGTLNGDFQREIDQKRVKNLVQISGSQ